MTRNLEDDPDADDPLDAVLIDCMERLTRGDAGAIEAACAADPEHAAEIRERIGLLLQMGLVPGAPQTEEFPEYLDQFRLLRRLGGGGMGVVYEAEQAPIGRTVALKLIRPEHLYFPRARERFRRETEAVAKLQHPGIVAIYTVGEAEGIPYFAMEKISGATLGEVLAQAAGRAPESLRGRDLRAALGAPDAPTNDEARELFRGTWVDACTRIVARVADALAHAHSRGVLHRDVKPSNVVVTPDGRVVLLDFGLASSQSELRMTLSGSALGSVLYMAPEQVRGRVDEIDERTDVYALGITLYELVTLQVPFIGDDAEHARAAILDGRPESMRARNRVVSRDLEVVCMTAIERERSRRYASMEAFARDLRNVLEHRPIVARAPGAALRTARWVQRNPTLSVAVAALLVLLVGIPLALFAQQHRHAAELELALDAQTAARRAADEASARAELEARRAALEAESAEQVANFLVDLFRAADPNRSRGREITARDLLQSGVAQIDAHLAGQPEIQARLLERVGQSFTHLDLYAEAMPVIERALAVRRSLSGSDDTRMAQLLVSLGKLRRLLGRDDCVAPLELAESIYRACVGDSNRLTLQCQSELAIAMTERGGARIALAVIDRALATQQQSLAPDIELREKLLGARMIGCLALQRFEEAEDAAREALELSWRVYRGPHPALISNVNGLANAVLGQGRVDEAGELYSDLVAVTRTVYGEDSTSYVLARMNRAVVLEQQGRLEEAEGDYRESWTRLRASVGDDHPNTVRCLGNLTHVLTRRGSYEEAVELCARALATIAERRGRDDELTLLAAYRLAAAHEALGQYERAQAVLHDALSGMDAQDRRRTAWVEIAYAGVLRRAPDTRAEARETLEGLIGRCIPLLERQVLYHLARLELDEDHAADAEAMLDRARELPEPAQSEGWAPAAVAALAGTCAIARGDFDAGEPELGEALAELERQLGARHATFVELVELAARAWTDAGEPERAAELRARLGTAQTPVQR